MAFDYGRTFNYALATTCFFSLVGLCSIDAHAESVPCLSANASKLSERMGYGGADWLASAGPVCDERAHTPKSGVAVIEIAGEAEILQQNGSRCRSSLKQFCGELKAAQFNVPSGREFLPTIPGLTPRAIRVKRNHISVHYTFK